MSSDDLLINIIVIAIGFLIVAAFYESLATRDVYVGRIMRSVRSRTDRRTYLAVAYVATVGLGIPTLVVLWAVVLTVALFAVGSVERTDTAGVVAVSVVGAARVLAYARQKTAQDLSKAIPLALAFLLITGGALNLEAKLERVRESPPSASLSWDLLFVLIGLELVLRIITDGSRAGLAEYRRRRGITSDLGLWRTLWTAVRRSVPADVFEAGEGKDEAAHGIAPAPGDQTGEDAN